MIKRITARKFEGDDQYSWTIFLDGRPVMTGLSKREVPYCKKEVEKIHFNKKARPKT
jgi:hypothetical protein